MNRTTGVQSWSVTISCPLQAQVKGNGNLSDVQCKDWTPI